MSEPLVSVGILNSPKIKFDLYGDFKSFGFSETFSGKFTAYIQDDIIIIENEDQKFKVTNEIIFEPSEFKSESFLLREVVIGVKFHWEQKENERFLGSLKLIQRER